MAPLLVGIVDVDSGEEEEATEHGEVATELLGGGLTTVVAEGGDDLGLDIVEEAAGEELLGGTIGEDDIALVEVLEMDALRLAEDIDGDNHRHTASTEADALDTTHLVLPAREEEGDTVADGHLAHLFDGEAEIDLQLMLEDEVAEGLLLGIADDDGGAAMVAVVIETEARAGVPVGGEDGTETIGGGVDEHETEEEGAQVVGGIGTHGEEGHVELEGRQGLCLAVPAAELTAALTEEHGLDPLGIGMDHDIPLAWIAGRHWFVHRHTFFLSAERGDSRERHTLSHWP